MAGRAPIKVYQYDANGKFMKEWACTNDVRRAYYPNVNGKMPFFPDGRGTYNAEYHELPDGSYVSKYRIGRERLLKLVKRDRSRFCKDCAEERNVVEVYNLNGTKVANFRNPYVASLLLQLASGQIDRRCQNEFTHGDLIFKYKRDDNTLGKDRTKTR